ncbi:MAG TPA: hypothetical protein VMZ01_04600 [Aestuariivirga sp.]|nr:hypothetical protein [Aestuariivirga sp.]
MVRVAMVSAVLLGLSPCAALAGQASASFQVGIVIGGGEGRSIQRAAPVKTYTWGAAIISVNRAGFIAPRPIEKSDTLYWFTAKRDGDSFRVAVSIFSGKVIRVLPA